jgi:rhomboid protease GluP
MEYVAANETLRILGANSRELVVGHGQWWRLLACMFLHGGYLHLTMNMISLYSLGGLLERLAGPWRFLLIYFLAGLCGSLAGLFNPAMQISVGASGAILGLAGALMALRWRRPPEMPLSLAKQVFQALLTPTIFIFGMGLALQVAAWLGVQTMLLDNFAHLGGLACGFGIFMIFPLASLPKTKPRS